MLWLATGGSANGVERRICQHIKPFNSATWRMKTELECGMPLRITNTLEDADERNCVITAIEQGLAHRTENGEWAARVLAVPDSIDFTREINGPGGLRIGPHRMSRLEINLTDSCGSLRERIYSWFPLWARNMPRHTQNQSHQKPHG